MTARETVRESILTVLTVCGAQRTYALVGAVGQRQRRAVGYDRVLWEAQTLVARGEVVQPSRGWYQLGRRVRVAVPVSREGVREAGVVHQVEVAQLGAWAEQDVRVPRWVARGLPAEAPVWEWTDTPVDAGWGWRHRERS